MTRKLLLLVVLAMMPVIGKGSSITLQGNFAADDSVQLFSVSILAPAAVDIRSYGYAGGTTSTAATVPSGGFDSVLTLFSASGVFIEDNDDGAGVANDPTTGLAGDARITANLTSGTYILALTQYDNFSAGNLADGFVESGNPNFTADPGFTIGGACPSNMFRDISGSADRCRTGNWAVDFNNVTTVTPVAPVPEPSALLLAGVGLVLLLATRCRSHKKIFVLPLALVAALATVPVYAQSTPPDYSNVSDFLNGQRTLLQIQDLQIMVQDSNYVAGGTALYTITTANSGQAQGPTSTPHGYTDTTNPYASFSAHMFNQAPAVTLNTMANFEHTGRLAVQVQNLQPAVNPSGSGPWLPLGDNPSVGSGAVADFTLDGFDDLALSLSDGRIVLLTPNDVNDFGKGPRTVASNADFLVALAAGDFNGDGKQELAGLNITPNGGLRLETFTVDQNTLNVVLTTSVTIAPDNPSNPITYYSLARGRFNASGHDQLVVAFAGQGVASTVEVIDFLANSLNPVIGPPASPAGNVLFTFGYFQVKTGKFGLPDNSFDQVVYHSSTGNQNGRFFEILTVNPITFSLGGTTVVQYSYPEYPCAAGLEVGNFDHQTANGQPDLNSQIAFMYCRPAPDVGQYGYTMNIYSVDPASLNINAYPNSQLNLPDNALNTANNQQIVFLATDLQGRSLTLGEPTRIAIKNTSQPSVIVGVPPMHIDYVSPTPGAAAELLNLSFMWDGFSTTYDQQQSSSLKTSTTNATSWSFGLKQQATTSLTIGDPDVEGLKVSDTFTAAEDLKGSSSNTHGTYTSEQYKLSNTTGIDDSVTYVNSDFYIWVYPVIGKNVCPSSNPGCQPNQQIPLTLQYSAANGNAAVTTGVDGGTLTWFQPPWEPGNIFSYPGNLAQLQLIFPTLTLAQLSNTGPTFDTSTSTTTEQATFDISTTDTPVTSFDQNYSFDNNFSVNGQIGFEGVSVGAGYDLDVNGSAALSYLSKSTTTLAESTGLVINKAGKFRLPDLYKYSITPYILGFQQPGGVVDNQPLSGDVKTFGFLSALYTVTPDVSSQGSWWKATYSQAPDIALNHPQRWSEAFGVTQPLESSCLDPGASFSQADCPSPNPSTPNYPITDLYHYMRGLFITNPNSPGQGPQLENIAHGDKLNLQARVYNYSLVPIQNANAYAAFYVAPSFVDNAPAQAMLIDTVQLPPIPQFDPSSTTTLNWLLTPSVIFDSGDPKYAALLQQGSNNVMFYVVVWIEDGTGNLITEMPVHGFKSKPSSSACTPSTLNQCTPSLSQWFQNEESFSNNIGLYPQAISVRSQSLGAVLRPLPPEASVNIGKLDISENKAKVSDIVLLSATLSPSGDTSGVNVNFYDGDPRDGGKMFKETRVPYIAGDERRLVRTVYRPSTCGTHQLFVVVNKGKVSEVARRAEPLQVACSGDR